MPAAKKGRTLNDSEERERREEAEEEVYELREHRVRVGPIARELDIRGVSLQHRAAHTQLKETLQTAREKAQKHGIWVARQYLLTELKPSIHMLGPSGFPTRVVNGEGKVTLVTHNPLVNWRIRQEFRNPYYLRRLLDPGSIGEEECAWFLDYVDEQVLAPAFAALWRQLGGSNQEPLNL
ncbi:MAG TPA: hypothetical protein VGV89_10375 [Thermoplasmata archaeon]|nr:hypothetical protein [Thermoplasmata archaeon]